MDETDLAILREAGRGTLNGWGNRDPRVSTNAIADRVGVPRSTVGARMRVWRESGFLSGYEIVPNPELFGYPFGAVMFHVPDPGHRDRIPKELALMDGVFGCIEHLDGWYEVVFSGPTRGNIERIASLIAQSRGVEWCTPAIVCPLPPVDITLNATDWKIIDTMRQDPMRSMNEAAEQLGMNERTLRRRYKRMLSGEAVWFVPRLDFTKWTGGAIVHMNVVLDEETHVAERAKELTDLLPEHLRVNESPASAIDAGEPILKYFIHLKDPVRAEYMVRKIDALDGVKQVQAMFPLQLHTYPQWVDDQVAINTRSTRNEPQGKEMQVTPLAPKGRDENP